MVIKEEPPDKDKTTVTTGLNNNDYEDEDDFDEDMMDEPAEAAPVAVFSKKPKEKKDFTAALGIKKKTSAPAVTAHKPAVPAPSKLSNMLVAGYDSDDD